MSNDSSICILQTLDGYRVALVHAPVNLYRCVDTSPYVTQSGKTKWFVNKHIIKAAFGNKQIFDSYDKAMESAISIHEVNQVEYGICIMREFMGTEFDKLIGGP